MTMYYLFGCLLVALVAGADPMRPLTSGIMSCYTIKLYDDVTHNCNIPFLKQCTPEGREEFLKIFNDTSYTVENMEQKINAWLAKQPAAVKDGFNTCKKDWDDVVNMVKKDYPSSNLTVSSKDALDALKAIGDSKKLTAAEKYEQTIETYNALTSEIKEELKKFVMEKMHSGHHHPHHHDKMAD